MRSTFINTLTEMARKNPKIMCVIGDTGFSVFENFEKEFGERFVNVGIAEQNFVSFGAGLAAMGMKPYIYNVVSFMTLRSLEQIELDICYQENPVVMVGVGGGHAYGPAGPTHHAYFDIGIMRMLPNMTVVCPADPVEMRAIMLASENYNKPLYIRIGRSVDPVIHEDEIDFQIGKALKMHGGMDGVLFATGTMVKDAMQVLSLLQQKGISLALYSMHTIKPLDEECVKMALEQYPAIFTLEEHSQIGGLGSAVEAILASQMANKNLKFRKFGFPDMFAPVTGSREYLNMLYGIDAESVAGQIMQVLGS
ncbi:transketolase family protein [Parablautia muri]|uniref:Transketolase n=1 Tax=Parablautia muri TaxID=2320879 RepID=A0A9X5BEN6_9FIRM|nr:transketolase C-terminal domain-containing protein [Parablautia muri]NBJ92505.1 transketolase [Parablautia muri]